jgi:tetrahydromethanopterin S-methyltransferase subunit E
MRFLNKQSETFESKPDRSLLVNSLTLIALGLSILFLNSWDTIVVRTTVGLFWGTFLLILNGPAAVQALRGLKKNNDAHRRAQKFSAE